MIDKRIVDWIKSKKASSGNSDLGFNKFLSQKGTLFMVIFYILLVVFSLQLIAEIVISLIQLKFLNLIFPLFFGGLTIIFIRKRNLYGILMIIFLFSPIGLLILAIFPFLQSFIAIGNVPFYVLLSILTLMVGLLIAFMFNKVSENFKKYLTTGVIFSSVLGLIFAIHSVIVTFISTILSILSAQVSQLSTGIPTGASGFVTSGLVSMFNFEIFDPNIAFILAFIFFNIPYAIFYFKRKDKNPKLFLLYLIPIIIFILLSFILNYVANNVNMILAVAPSLAL